MKDWRGLTIDDLLGKKLAKHQSDGATYDDQTVEPAVEEVKQGKQKVMKERRPRLQRGVRAERLAQFRSVRRDLTEMIAYDASLIAPDDVTPVLQSNKLTNTIANLQKTTANGKRKKFLRLESEYRLLMRFGINPDDLNDVQKTVRVLAIRANIH